MNPNTVRALIPFAVVADGAVVVAVFGGYKDLTLTVAAVVCYLTVAAFAVRHYFRSY
jgi:hypothetical protein